MSPTSLSASEAKRRFGVEKEIALFPESLTSQEEENVKVVLEYMEVSEPASRVSSKTQKLPFILSRF